MKNLSSELQSRNNTSRSNPLFKAWSLLSEAQQQRVFRNDALRFVLSKWKYSQESEIPIISKRLQFWLFLVSAPGLVLVILLALLGYFCITNIGRLLSLPVDNLPNNIQSDCLNQEKCILLLNLADLKDAISPNFDMGELVVKIKQENFDLNESLSIYNQTTSEGKIKVEGKNVYFNDLAIGTFEGGNNAKSLVIKFNQNSTREAAQALVRSIVYQNNVPSSSLVSRQIEFKITDGDGGISKPFIVNIIDRGPVLHVPEKLTVKDYSQLIVKPIKLSNSNISDLEMTLEATNGIINIKQNIHSGLTENQIRSNQTEKVTIFGTSSQINTTLNSSSGIIYRPTNDFAGDVTLNITVNTGRQTVLWPPISSANANSVSKLIKITVVSSNPPPVITVPGDKFTNENAEIPISGISLNDPNDTNLTVILGVSNGVLTLQNTIPNGLNAKGISNNKTQIVTLKGSIVQINNTLASIIYRGNKNYTGKDNIVITASDGSKNDQKTVSVTVNDNPIISVLDSTPPPLQFDTNATIIGESGAKNIRSGPGLKYLSKHIAYPGDRVQALEPTLNSDKFCWYRVFLPQFGIEGWIAGNLLRVEDPKIDCSTLQNRSPEVNRVPNNGTNATVSGDPGSKNVRAGAGTNYGVVGTINTGDRIQILSVSYDIGGFQWFQVYHPASGIKGWIAEQLITRD